MAEIAAKTELMHDEIREKERRRRLTAYQHFVDGFNKLYNTFGYERTTSGRTSSATSTYPL